MVLIINVIGAASVVNAIQHRAEVSHTVEIVMPIAEIIHELFGGGGQRVSLARGRSHRLAGKFFRLGGEKLSCHEKGK